VISGYGTRSVINKSLLQPIKKMKKKNKKIKDGGWVGLGSLGVSKKQGNIILASLNGGESLGQQFLIDPAQVGHMTFAFLVAVDVANCTWTEINTPGSQH